MPIYVLTNDQNEVVKYPYNAGLLRRDNPNTSFPKVISSSTLNAFNVFSVNEVKPEITSTQRLIKPSEPVYQDGQWSLAYTVEDFTQSEIDALISKLKSDKLKSLFDYCDTQLELLATNYPEREAATWPVQLEEAKAYLADNTSSTPFINAALTDGETVESYANLIIANNAQWSSFAGSIVKYRRNTEKAIQETTTVEGLEAIEVTL